MRFVARSTIHVAVAVAVLMVPATKLHAQDECQCTAPGAESSRIANAIGGGLFAGLIAAVIPFHHAAALASAPSAGAGAPSALTLMSDSTDIAPGDSTRPRRVGTYAATPSGAGAPPDGGAPISRTSNGESASPLPALTADEAAAEGMIAPKTATLLPALAMIGVGAMLMGIFFLRVRRPRLRSR
jgi:hypothetical protein